MPNRTSDVIIIGGGASGIVAALAAGQAGAKVTVLEKNIRVGKSILSTGNGRCNISNSTIGKPESFLQYNNPEFVSTILKRYDSTSIRLFFYDLGLLTIVEKNLWVFPRTQSANTVLDVLLKEMERLAVNCYTGQEIIGLRISEEGYRVETTTASYSAKALILACGVEPLLTAFAFLNTASSTPILGPLKTDVDPIRGLDGVRVNAKVSLMDGEKVIASEEGEILFRDYGVSGIVIFNLSRHAKPGHTLSIDLFPELTERDLLNTLEKRLTRRPDLNADELLTGMLHSRIIQAVIRKSKSRTNQGLDQGMLYPLAQSMKKYQLKVTGGPSKDQAQVTRGGLGTDSFNPETLEAKNQAGLFACGECLDIDGPCGGYNLHWAWASGLVAGEQAAKYAC